jgi:hypothetical protein
LVYGSSDENKTTDVILSVKGILVSLDVDNHDVRPVPENDELEHCRNANCEDVDSLPLIELTVDEDLDGFQTEEINVFAIIERFNEVEADTCVVVQMRHVNVRYFHGLKGA